MHSKNVTRSRKVWQTCSFLAKHDNGNWVFIERFVYQICRHHPIAALGLTSTGEYQDGSIEIEGNVRIVLLYLHRLSQFGLRRNVLLVGWLVSVSVAGWLLGWLVERLLWLGGWSVGGGLCGWLGAWALSTHRLGIAGVLEG